jgi:DNA-binding SARP family transcriptional activator/class 3 adenylate cyclase
VPLVHNRCVSDEVRLWLLGGFRAEVDGQPVAAAAWRRSGATALVKLLALRPGHRLHREQAIDKLWPEAGATAGAARLNKALHFARRALGRDHLRLHDDLLSLAAGTLWVDLDALEAAAGRGDTEDALALYTGELLPENRFDDWVEPRRAQLHATVARLLLDQAADRADREDPAAAVAALERLVALDPLNEEAYARLMRLAAAAGVRHVALRWYDRLTEALHEHLGVEPNDDLRALQADIAAGRLGPGPAPATGPSPLPGAGPAVGPEERKLVTVLDMDLRGLPAPPGQRDPERARRETTTWTDLFCEVVGRWGGAVQRHVGGGVVAVFGYPAAREDHAARALWAGFEVLQRTAVPVRMGVDTGEVIAPDPAGPDPGSDLALTGIGGAVLDGAARLREAARPGTLLAAERTGRAAQPPSPSGASRFRFGPPVRLDWSDGAPVAHRLLSAAWVAEDRPAAAEPPRVGREDELRAVLSLIDEVSTSGRPRLITVVGAAGVGKSRLVRDVVLAAVERRPETRVLRGRCLAAGDGITYWALGEILREACGIALGETGRVAQQRLRDRLRPLLTARLNESDVDATIHALAATAAIPLPDNPLDDAAPRDVAEELARAWPRFATAIAAGGPLILVVEDLHWAGRPLLDMLVRLAARSAGPVVVLTTARPEPGPGAGSAEVSAETSTIALRSLTAPASRELLANHPRAAGLDKDARAGILARAEGNPYFLDQLVVHVADGAFPEGLPDTLHALLAARVDALPPAEKHLLQAAAVVGRVFWTEPLRRRLGDDLAGPLTALENRGLIVAHQTSSLAGQVEFAFRHALLRDVAYASRPAAHRALGHADTAAWLEEISRERIGEVIELVAFHYEAGAASWPVDATGPTAIAPTATVPDEPRKAEWVRGKAFRSLIAAGVSARHRYAADKALALHEQALQYADGAGERAEAIAATGDDHEIAFDGDLAVAAWQAAITTLRTVRGHLDRRAELCLKTAQMAVTRWGGFRRPIDPTLGDRFIDEGLAIVSDPSIRSQLLSLRALCGGRWAWTGRADPVAAAERHRAAQAAQALADRLDSPTLRSLAQLGLASVYFLQRRYDDAVVAVLDEVALVEQGGQDRDRAMGHAIACHVIGTVYADYERALGHARQSYALGHDLAAHDQLHGTYVMMTCLEQLGRWAEIPPYLAEHRRLRQGREAEMSCPYIRSGMLVGALTLARGGDPAAAREVADQVVIDLDHPGNAEALHGQLSIELGDAEAGRAVAERLVRLGRRPGPEEVPHENLVLVDALRVTGDHAALREFLPAARESAGFLAAITPTCDRAEGAAQAAAGDHAGAIALLTRAIAGFDRLGLPLPAARTREELARLTPDQAPALRQAALHTYLQLGATPDATRLHP